MKHIEPGVFRFRIRQGSVATVRSPPPRRRMTRRYQCQYVAIAPPQVTCLPATGVTTTPHLTSIPNLTSQQKHPHSRTVQATDARAHRYMGPRVMDNEGRRWAWERRRVGRTGNLASGAVSCRGVHVPCQAAHMANDAATYAHVSPPAALKRMLGGDVLLRRKPPSDVMGRRCR